MIRFTSTNGDDVVMTDTRQKVAELILGGYQVFHNADLSGQGFALGGDVVVADEVTDEMDLIAIRRVAGG